MDNTHVNYAQQDSKSDLPHANTLTLSNEETFFLSCNDLIVNGKKTEPNPTQNIQIQTQTHKYGAHLSPGNDYNLALAAT